MPSVNKAKSAKSQQSSAMPAAQAHVLSTVEGINIEHVTHAGLNARIIRGNRQNALIEFLDTENLVINTAFYPQIEDVMCFTPAAKIMTPDGPRHAGDLQPGDLIVTRDNGAKPLAWVGQKTLSMGSLINDPSLAPVTIKAGALGNGLPVSDLTISPNHRILVSAQKRDVMMNAPEVLMSAQSLLGHKGVAQSVPNGVTYLHLMFEQHELIMSEGAWSESFQPTKAAISGVESQQKADLFTLFPDLKALNSDSFQHSVRPEIKDDGEFYPPQSGMQNSTHSIVVGSVTHSQMPRVDHGFASFGSRYKSKSSSITRNYGLVSQREDEVNE